MTDERKYDGVKVLYVDDEEQSLKYFTMAMKRVVQVVTAKSGAEALEILSQRGEEIGAMITDQRMPGLSGVQLLREVRSNYPHVVRLLTTAFAELEQAIEAVNSGAIFAYVTKPWKLPELGNTITQALEYSRVQRERDALLAEKLAVVRQRAGVERLKVVSILSAAFGHRLDHADTAALEFCEHARLLESTESSAPENVWDALWLEAGQVREIAHSVNRALDVDAGQLGAIDTADCWANVASAQEVELNIACTPQLPKVRGSQQTLCGAFRGVLEALRTSPNQRLAVSATLQPDVRGTPGIRWTLNDGVNGADLASAYREPATGGLLSPLLTTYFLVCHASGAVKTLGEGGLALDLPLDPSRSRFVPAREDSFEALFQRLEGF